MFEYMMTAYLIINGIISSIIGIAVILLVVLSTPEELGSIKLSTFIKYMLIYIVALTAGIVFNLKLVSILSLVALITLIAVYIIKVIKCHKHE